MSAAKSRRCWNRWKASEEFRGFVRRFRLSPGAWQSPTVLNNVETFCAVPAIILNGGAWFANLGTPKNGGTRLFCLSGHVNKPGVYELPMGFNLLRMINEVGGGICEWQEVEGRRARRLLLSGAARRGMRRRYGL